MAAGKPVVATNVGGAAEAINDGESGYLVNSDDDTAMAKRLMELLNDTKLAASMGKNGRRIAKDKFSPHKQLGQTTLLYKRFLKIS